MDLAEGSRVDGSAATTAEAVLGEDVDGTTEDFKVHVSLLSGRHVGEFSLHASSCYVFNLLEQVASALAVNPKGRQTLSCLWQGRELHETASLMQAGVTSGADLLVILRNKAGPLTWVQIESLRGLMSSRLFQLQVQWVGSPLTVHITSGSSTPYDDCHRWVVRRQFMLPCMEGVDHVKITIHERDTIKEPWTYFGQLMLDVWDLSNRGTRCFKVQLADRVVHRNLENNVSLNMNLCVPGQKDDVQDCHSKKPGQVCIYFLSVDRITALPRASKVSMHMRWCDERANHVDLHRFADPESAQSLLEVTQLSGLQCKRNKHGQNWCKLKQSLTLLQVPTSHILELSILQAPAKDEGPLVLGRCELDVCFRDVFESREYQLSKCPGHQSDHLEIVVTLRVSSCIVDERVQPVNGWNGPYWHNGRSFWHNSKTGESSPEAPKAAPKSSPEAPKAASKDSAGVTQQIMEEEAEEEEKVHDPVLSGKEAEDDAWNM